MAFGVLAFSVDDYASRPTLMSEALTGVVVYALLCAVELALRYTMAPLLAHCLNLSSLQNDNARIKLGRFGMTVLAMGWFAWAGYDALFAQGGFDTVLNSVAIKGIEPVNGYDVHYQRLYGYIPAAQRLALFHAAWEFKNFFDSVVHKDGVIFIAHHIGAFAVAIGCMLPVYHPYVCYFLGFSEISSVVLPLCAALDEQLGIPELGQKIPAAKLVFGGAFAVLFLMFRIAAWLPAAYVYTMDGLAVLQGNQCRSVPVLVMYLVGIGFFTLLQLIWCVELFQRSYAMLMPRTASESKKLS